ncbi:MAG: hypothetical protein NVS3B1_05980 [Marmoricola sp.]
MTRGDQRKDLVFIKAHWRQDMKAPIRRDPDDPNSAYFKYTCDMFDPVARDCNAHESRPPICSQFPKYGRETIETLDPILTGCTFWNDIPREHWPQDVAPLTRALLPLTVLDAQQRKDAQMTTPEPQFDVTPDPSLVTAPSTAPVPQFDVDPPAADVVAPSTAPVPQFDVVPPAAEVTAPDPNAAPGEPGSA